MFSFFIKDDEDTLPNATFVLEFLLIQFRIHFVKMFAAYYG